VRPKEPWPRLRIAVLALLVLATIAAVWYWREPLWELFSNRDLAQERIARLGPWGPLVSIGLNTAQVVLGPVPGYVIGLLNGYLYGVWLGTLYSILGLLFGTALAMTLARYFGRPLVERLVPSALLARWDRLAAQRGPLFFFLVFLVPAMPDDIVCFVIGLSPLPIGQMVALATIGRLPGVFVSCWFGERASELPLWAWIPLVAGTVGLAWAFVRFQARLEAFALRVIHRLAPHRSHGLTRAPYDSVEDRPTSD
jgi:uncharacterized membrane protein YdjX (TVP38/TMEM64 family)